jgi:Circularly permutated YpsA SLOG family
MQLRMALEKIVSGGQTGVDRGALDACLEAHFPCGGWCPGDRSAEDGTIPESYPLTPLPGGGFRQRTRQNVLDSDGTLILFDGSLTAGELTGGSQLTREVAQQYGKPLLLINAARMTTSEATDTIVAWLREQAQLKILNVAGPRASGWPGGYDYTQRVVRKLLLA